MTLCKLTIQNGSAAGGGVLNWGTLTVSQSTITGNFTGSKYSAVGRGIYNTGTLTLNSSTVTKNTVYAVFAYGGVYAYGGGRGSSGKLAINNSSITNNTTTASRGGGGGGIYVSGGPATISNSTISLANSSAGGNCYGTITSHGYNLSSHNSCNFTKTGNLNGINPMLGPVPEQSRTDEHHGSAGWQPRS